VPADDGTWTLKIADADRERVLAEVGPARVLRLGRQRIALEDWFVERVRSSHHAGHKLGGAA
jgi:hypothetical protein